MNTRNHSTPTMINRPAKKPEPVSESGFRTGLALFTLLFFVWFMFAADFAGAAAYKGKTKGGSSITFALKGNRVTGIRTVVPTLCLETTGGYTSRAGSELFQPVAGFTGLPFFPDTFLLGFTDVLLQCLYLPACIL